MRPNLSHSQTDNGAEGFEWRRRGEVRRITVIMRLELPGNEAGSVIFIGLVALVRVNPAHSNWRFTGASPGFFVWNLHPYASLVEEVQFDAPGFQHGFVFENLSCDVIFEFATVTVESSLAKRLDLLLVVSDLDSEASILKQSVLLELLDDTPDNGLAEPSGVYGRFLSDATAALRMLCSMGAQASCARTCPAKSFGQTLCVAEKPSRFLYGATLHWPVGDLCAILALVCVREGNARDLHQLLHGRKGP